MTNSTSEKEVESVQQLDQVRNLIVGKNSYLVTDTIKKEARNIVGDVLTESLHDRQKKDGSVNKVLQPLVENSVEYSVTHQSDKLVNSLYPLIGSLIRKSVTAFLTDFMEKTNQLIENSFTLKGLKWRFTAWQSGVSFAQYVASQIFVYRVEHVFLIHRETGLLLQSVGIDNKSGHDADLISSMLTAINDFVGDSFTTSDEGLKEQLQTVTTDTFNLLIKPGPHAFVVAAVIGNPPQKINDQLQLTLEGIHSLYNDELNQFSGDNKEFENTRNLLQDCLMSEQKNIEANNTKPLWFAWSCVLIITIYISFLFVNHWQNTQLSQKIMKLDNEPGISLKHIKVLNSNTVELNFLRDPEAVKVNEWFEKNNLSVANIILNEDSYYSLDEEITYIRVMKILAKYPDVEGVKQGEALFLSGEVSSFQRDSLLNQLSSIGFNEGQNLNTNTLILKVFEELNNTKALKVKLFNDLVGRISTIQLNFISGSDEITLAMTAELERLYYYVKQLSPLAEEIGVSFGVLVMGCSDNTGNRKVNEDLSLSRAKRTSEVLSDFGLDLKLMYVTGLGELEIQKVNAASRKVMFNVIYVNKENNVELKP